MPDAALGPPRAPAAPLAAALAVVALGGALGASARYGLGLWWPTASGAFPVTTLVINVVGSLLIGVLVGFIQTRRPSQTLLRPFVGTGILGGFTTFSTFSVDAQRLLVHDAVLGTAAYVVLTPVLSILAAAVGLWWTRRSLRRVSR